jgi:hypothetical protein
MKPAITILMLMFACSLYAQSKPDTAKVKAPETLILSMDKLKARFDDLQKARERAVKTRDDADNNIKAIDGALQALQMVATDSTLQEPKKVKK